MTRTTREAPTCAYPGCTNEPRPAEEGAKARYCGLPDPVSGQPHTALTSFLRRRELAAQAGVTEPEDSGGPGDAFWHPGRRRRADEQRHQQAEADAEEARSAILEAESRARAAEQEAARARQAAESAQKELDKAREAGGPWLVSEGSVLGELVEGVSEGVEGVYEAMDWLMDRDTGDTRDT